MDTQDPIPLSALNQYTYCPRRFFLVHAEGEFSENIHTISGTLEHERVDQLHHEVRSGIRIVFSLPVWSDRLGLTGRCDVVEFHQDGTIYPVEYKHGKRKQWLNDDLQLAGQAICLSEMHEKSIPQGAIFHTQSKRRREINIDQILIAKLEETVFSIRNVIATGLTPPPLENSRRCTECSLIDICQPELLKSNTTINRLAQSLFDIQDSD
ncbi:MAG: CRISPR-associated protein Cas4 [Methylococcaceae bacterium]